VVVADNRARAERSYVRKARSTSSYSNIFPGAHLKWEPFDGVLFRGSYNRSITRPNILSMLPTATVDDLNRTISVGNPELKPYLANNYDVSIERYFEPVGLVSVGVFRKDITQYFRSFSDVVPSGGIDGNGSYEGYTRTTSRNIGSARIRGIELNLQQQFRNLPGLWKGFGAFANFTYLEALGNFGSATISRRLPNMSPRTGNFGLSYVGHGWQIRPLLNWTGKTYRGTSGVLDFDSAARTWIDMKIQYALSRRYALEFSAFNLTNAAESELLSSDGRFPFVQIKPGTAYSVGLTARF
jgi:TonB-dependent receptor